MELNPSVIFYTDGLAAEALAGFAHRLEELGYESLWVPEFFGREPFSTVAYLLARTSKLKIATGIANVYARDALVTAQARQTLGEFSGGRFILGLGVSHPPMAEAHGLDWKPAVPKMRGYLDTLDNTQVESPRPSEPVPVWIAAHGPGLLRLAAERTDGANTYLMPPAHTQRAREILGPDKRLNTVVPSCLCEDPDRARKIARKALAIYLPLPAYQKQWLEWGFSQSDFQNGGSDALVDGLVAWGNEEQIRTKMLEHRSAGASHIAVSPLDAEGRGPEPPWKLLEALAPSSR